MKKGIDHHTHTYKVPGTVTPIRYSYTYEVQLHLKGTATPKRYRYAYEVQLHLRGTATPMRYSYTYQVQLHLQGTSTSTRYSYTCEIQLHLGGTETVHHFFEPGEEGVLVSEIRDIYICGRAYFGQYTISMVPDEFFLD